MGISLPPPKPSPLTALTIKLLSKSTILTPITHYTSKNFNINYNNKSIAMVLDMV